MCSRRLVPKNEKPRKVLLRRLRVALRFGQSDERKPTSGLSPRVGPATLPSRAVCPTLYAIQQMLTSAPILCRDKSRLRVVAEASGATLQTLAVRQPEDHRSTSARPAAVLKRCSLRRQQASLVPRSSHRISRQSHSHPARRFGCPNQRALESERSRQCQMVLHLDHIPTATRRGGPRRIKLPEGCGVNTTTRLRSDESTSMKLQLHYASLSIPRCARSRRHAQARIRVSPSSHVVLDSSSNARMCSEFGTVQSPRVGLPLSTDHARNRI
jgi:hypothetical protein